MNNPDTSGKCEIIEQALQQAVGGGLMNVNICSFSCHVFSINVCDVDFCGTSR